MPQKLHYYIHHESACAFIDYEGVEGDGCLFDVGEVRSFNHQEDFEDLCRHVGVKPPYYKVQERTPLLTMNPPPPMPPPAPVAQVEADPEFVRLSSIEEDITAWENAQVQLTRWKSVEGTLRRKLAEVLGANLVNAAGVLDEGTNKCSYSLATIEAEVKIVQKYNHKLDESSMVVTLQEADLTPAEGYGLIKTSYEVSMSVLKKLPQEKQDIVRKMLTSKPGSIELEIKTVPKP